jgi:hypothetical protein
MHTFLQGVSSDIKMDARNGLKKKLLHDVWLLIPLESQSSYLVLSSQLSPVFWYLVVLARFHPCLLDPRIVDKALLSFYPLKLNLRSPEY